MQDLRYAEIISRSVILNGKVQAQNIALIQGNNHIDFEKGTIKSIHGEGIKPKIAIDTQALGGMYAEKIRIISTEKGVGVNLKDLQTIRDNLNVTVDGKINVINTIQSKQDINISANELTNNYGKITAEKDITLAALHISNQGKIFADKDIRLFVGKLNNQGKNAQIQASNNLWIQKNTQDEPSTIIENKSATIKTITGDLIIRTKKLVNKTITPISQKTDQEPDSDLILSISNRLLTPSQSPTDDFLLYIALPKFKGMESPKWFGIADIKNGKGINVERSLFKASTEFTPAIISSGKNIYIQANELDNYQSKITADQNLIATGNNANFSYYRFGNLDKWDLYSPELENFHPRFDLSEDKILALRFPITSTYIPYKKLGSYYQYTIDNDPEYLLSAEKNLVLDFKDKINLTSKFPFSNIDVKKVNNSVLSGIAIKGNNILFKADSANISMNIDADNDLSIITSNDINLKNILLSSANALNLIANRNIRLEQTSLFGNDNTLITRQGNIENKLNPISAVETGELMPPFFSARNSANIQAGKSILFENINIAKGEHLNITAKDDIRIQQDDALLLTLLPDKRSFFRQKVLSDTSLWLYSGGITFTAGKDIISQNIKYSSDNGIINFNAGQDIILATKPSDAVDPLLRTDYYPQLLSKLLAEKNIIFNAGRDIDLTATYLWSKNKIALFSGRDLKLGANPYSAINNSHEDLQNKRYATSSLQGDKGITLAANGAITTQGSLLKSDNNIMLSSTGNLRLESVKTHYRKQQDNKLEDIYQHIGTDIKSGKNITLFSMGSILFQAAKLSANNIIDVAAQGGYLYAQAMEETNHYEEKKKKCNKWTLCITKKTVTNTFNQINNKVTEFIANGNIQLFANDDITLEATKINTKKNTKIISKTGSIHFKAVKNSQFKQALTNAKDFYITQRNQGYSKENWVLPSLHMGGNLTVNAPNIISADIKTKRKASLETALTVLSNTPEYAWLKELQHENINWNLVKDTYASWDDTQEQLNPVVGAVIAIAVAVATYGTSIAASVGGMASSTVTAAGASASVASSTAIAAQAGFASLASQAAVALAEHKGDLYRTLKSLNRSETTKSIVTSMAVAGALQGLDQYMGWDGALKGSSLPSTSKLLLTHHASWNQVAQRVAAHSIVSSSLNTAIQGGRFIDNFNTALLSNMGGQFHAESANLIGNHGEVLGHAGKVLSHAVVAGISAEIAGNNVTGAVVGALAAEIAAISLGDNMVNIGEWKRESEAQAQLIRIFGGLVGGIFTGDLSGVYSGANSAETTFRFNYLLHDLAIDFDNEIQRCRGQNQCEEKAIRKYAIFSLKNSNQLDLDLINKPLVVQTDTKQYISSAFDLAKRPNWLSYLGFDIMQNNIAKKYLMYWNSQDLNKIDSESPGWTKAAVFISDPEVQASLISLGWLSKQLIQKSILTVSSLNSDKITSIIKSTQIGLERPGKIDQIKLDMLNNNYNFTGPKGIIGGYLDKNGIYYVSEGNHRMVAAKEIYMKTGDHQYIKKLLENGRWTAVNTAPVDAKKLPSRH